MTGLQALRDEVEQLLARIDAATTAAEGERTAERHVSSALRDRLAEAHARERALVDRLAEQDRTIRDLQGRNATLAADIESLRTHITNTKGTV